MFECWNGEIHGLIHLDEAPNASQMDRKAKILLLKALYLVLSGTKDLSSGTYIIKDVVTSHKCKSELNNIFLFHILCTNAWTYSNWMHIWKRIFICVKFWLSYVIKTISNMSRFYKNSKSYHLNSLPTEQVWVNTKCKMQKSKIENAQMLNLVDLPYYVLF